MAFAGDSLKQIKSLLRPLSISTSSSSNGNRSSNENLTNSLYVDSSSADSSSSSSGSSAAESDEYTNSDYPGVLDVDLTSLTAEQRTVFIVTVAVLFVLSLCGNMGTLFVNVRRKIRPFFRACLISLAISDSLSSFFLTSAYMSQFAVEYVQIWNLGAFMCSFVPFITTAAILASSMVLVGIALDRYFAVMRAAVRFWNPGVTFSCVCISTIWAAAIGIASPVFCIYETYLVYILKEQPEEGGGSTNEPISSIKPPNVVNPALLTSTSSSLWEQAASRDNLTYILVQEQELVAMCISNKRNVGLYYIIVFSIIFIPCIISFIWLNSIIAKKLWLRRHSLLSKVKSKKKAKSTTNSFKLLNANVKPPITAPMKPCTCQFGHHSTENNTLQAKVDESTAQAGAPTDRSATSTAGATKANTNTNANTKGSSARESRHIRMFTVVILLMAVFLFFRLPAWIFLVMRVYGSYGQKVHWIIYFSFGIMNLTSCVLNPLFYTFLAQSIAYLTWIKITIWDNRCGLRLLYGSSRRNSSVPIDTPAFLATNGAPPELEPNWTCGCCCSACGLPKPTFFYAGPPKKRNGSLQKEELPPVIIKQPLQVLKDDKDEGVECSDVSDDGDSMNGFYNERAYTIFPVALVSTSVGSE